ncbi:MAG TPA: hypothetical protein VMU01_11715 [Rhizomicrobium sp.]|nr:hypothetical protein [Rhizomicrobium sp.]
MRLGGAALLLTAVFLAAGAQAAPAGWKHYSDKTLGLSIAYPPDWSLVPNVDDGLPGPQTPHGIVLTPPRSLGEGTNLDSTEMMVVAVAAKDCTPDKFDPDGNNVHPLNADGRTYMMSSHQDVVLGDTYGMQTFVVTGLKRCIAVKYSGRAADMHHFIPGEAKPYDLKQLWAVYDSVRATLVFRK